MPIKGLIRKILRSCGYQIGPLNRFGSDPLVDIRKIFGDNPPSVMFDVGANEGQTASEYASAFPNAKIYSFEPFGQAFSKLNEVALHFPGITPVQCALGETIGSKELYLNVSSATNSLLQNAPQSGSFQPKGMAVPIGSTTVPVCTVDEYCKKQGIERIDVLKTDTQGYDLSVLRGADQMIAEQRIGVVFSEMLFTPLYSGQAQFQDLYIHLLNCGFRLVNLHSVCWNEQNYASWCDGLFVHPEAIARRLSKGTA